MTTGFTWNNWSDIVIYIYIIKYFFLLVPYASTSLTWGNPLIGLLKMVGKWCVPLAQFQNPHGSPLTSKAARAHKIDISSMPLLWPWPWLSAPFSPVGPEQR